MSRRPDPGAHVDAVSLDHLDAWPVATSLTTEYDTDLRIEGTLPSGLSGTLYRNGPGRFERAGLRKNHLLDGDGMVQAFTIADGRVHYRNRFVRTPKFVEEADANRYLYDTWTTRRPDSEPTDPPAIENQAGVTVVRRGEHLYALDDGPGISELDPRTLDTLGPANLDLPDGVPSLFTAHTRVDPLDDSWTLTAGTGAHQHVVTLDRRGRFERHTTIPLPRPAWMHDFLMTETRLVFICHPFSINPMLFQDWGWSLWDSFEWRPDDGNLIVVADREGRTPPEIYEAPTAFTWHGLNACDHGADTIVDFIGYTHPDHAVGDDPQLRAIMEGRPGDSEGRGSLRRLVLTPGRAAATENTLFEGCEFPHVPADRVGRPTSTGYLATVRPGDGVLPSGLAAIGLEDGDVDAHQFGPREYSIEPIFAPDPAHLEDPHAGWLLTIVNDADRGAARLEVLDARSLANGPVATVRLDHTTPFSFHGWWSPAL